MPPIEPQRDLTAPSDRDLADVALGHDLIIEEPTYIPAFENFTQVLNLVRQPPALQSEETLAGVLQDFVANEVEYCKECELGELAYRVADLLVHREAEVAASSPEEGAMSGLMAVADLARMFEHIFLARGGAALE